MYFEADGVPKNENRPVQAVFVFLPYLAGSLFGFFSVVLILFSYLPSGFYSTYVFGTCSNLGFSGFNSMLLVCLEEELITSCARLTSSSHFFLFSSNYLSF